MRNPFAYGNFQDRSRKFIVVVIILLCLLFVAAFFAKPAWRSTKDRRALKFVVAANAAMAADDAALAAGHLRAAHALSPCNPAVLRATGTHFSRLSRAEGLIYWQQLENSGQMTDADRFAYVRLALACGDFEAARQGILPFAKSRPKDPETLRLLAEVFLGFKELDLAANTLREALDVAPFRPDLEIVLSRVELAQADPRNQRTAKANEPVGASATVATSRPFQGPDPVKLAFQRRGHCELQDRAVAVRVSGERSPSRRTQFTLLLRHIIGAGCGPAQQ